MHETLLYNKYEIRNIQRSQIDPGAMISVPTGLRCPRCKEVLKVMDHGKKQTCHKCDLKLQLFGNGLHCYDEDADPRLQGWSVSAPTTEA